jgi:hypothetical protein
MVAPLVASPPSLVPRLVALTRSLVQKNRLATNKHASTEPDVTAVTVMLTKLLAAVRRTIERRHAAGTSRFARAPLGLDRFFAAMMNPLGGQAALQPDPTLPRRVDSRSWGAPSQAFRIKPLSRAVNET